MSLKIRIEEVSLVVIFMYQGGLRKQTIEIVKVRCFELYHRQYLVCPVCGERRNQLYMDSTGKFSCRVCINLGYRTQRLNPHQRHAYTAEKLRKEKLKSLESCPNTYIRPKYMKIKTYHKLLDKIHWHEKKSSELFIDYFRDMQRKFDRQNPPGSLAAWILATRQHGCLAATQYFNF